MTRVLVAASAVAFLILTYIFFIPVLPSGEPGICFPSPNQWRVAAPVGWAIDFALLLFSALTIAYANKRFNFVSENRYLIPFSLFLLTACNCVTTAYISTSTLMLLLNVVALLILLSTFEARNATREFFIIASLASIGSMIQYSFLVMTPAYIFGGLAMKSFRIREFFAFIFGLAAPYWVAIGLGLVSLASLRLPASLGIFSTAKVNPDIFLTLIEAGIMALLGLILSLYNGVNLYSRNVKLRSMHMLINITGYFAVAAMIFDFNNFTSYFGTVALWLSIETASLAYFYRLRHPDVLLWLLLLLFVPLYILTLT